MSLGDTAAHRLQPAGGLRGAGHGHALLRLRERAASAGGATPGPRDGRGPQHGGGAVGGLGVEVLSVIDGIGRCFGVIVL